MPVRDGEQRCPQCWKPRVLESFFGHRGDTPHRFRACVVCRRKYRGWSKKTFDQKLALQKPRAVTGTGYRVSFVLRSGNRKLGGIPVSMTDRASCPTTCGLRERGCYAEFHNQRAHWEKVGNTGMGWIDFCGQIAALPPGTIWRHNEAGDLPGRGDDLDVVALTSLVAANRGRRGFTFTHQHRQANHLAAIRAANDQGFVVNLSADSLEQADELAGTGAGPVVVTVESDAAVRLRTPAGRRVVICPNQTSAHLTCRECRLCAVPDRKAIVGFRAHGQYRALVSELVRSRHT